MTEVNISRSDYQPEYQVDFDREKLAMHGLNLSTAGNYLRNRVNGAVASKYREDGDEYDIKVRYAPDTVQAWRVSKISSFTMHRDNPFV